MGFKQAYEVKANDMGDNNISIGRWRIIAIFFAILSIGLAVALVVVIIKTNTESDRTTTHTVTCKSTNSNYGNINFEESSSLSVFHHLTAEEIESLVDYLYSRSELNLVRPVNVDTDKSFIYLSDLYLPNKEAVLDYLDRNLPKPPREAIVIIFRGDTQPPYVEEIVVGPLPNPTTYKSLRTIPYIYRPPFSGNEYYRMVSFLKRVVDSVLGSMFLSIYGGRLLNCGNKCLEFGYITPVSPKLSGIRGRSVWCTLVHSVEYSKHHPLEFSVFVTINMTDFNIEKVWFSSRIFNNLNEVLKFYNSNQTIIPMVDFPDSTYTFSTMRQRGVPPMDVPLRNPKQVSPDGKRYNIQDRHVKYMFWEFDFRMAIIQGPQLYNIKFKNERIAYELSLQEIAVLYSGFQPSDAMAHFLDSVGLIGSLTRVLVPGIDCPEDATFIGTTFLSGDKPFNRPTSFCLFELNTGMPLRRHNGYWFSEGRFYEGMENVVLVLRSIPTIGVYDYVIDFVFYQTGALEVKVTSMGYVKSSFYTNDGTNYSFKLHENLAAPIHHHLFNFKADLDIKGTSNRFATLNIETEEISNFFSVKSNATLTQHRFSSAVKRTELDAAYQFDFKAPKYLLMYNDQQKDPYGNSKGYRIYNRGMTKQILPKDSGNEPIVSWSRYQLAVTKYNDSERTSSSVYWTLDVEEQVVNFQEYIDDNDNIVDQDLVAWITMGHHHIPHTEDLPVTTSPGMDVSFFLLPYNYFDEDPSIASKNAVRYEPLDKTKRGTTLTVQRYGVGKDVDCMPEKNRFDEEVRNEPNRIFDN